MKSPRLTINARVKRDDFIVDLDFAAEPGRVTGISGDIGSGKTTVLWLVAGRLRADAGVVELGDQVWDEPSAGRFEPRRSTALLSQRFQADLAEERTGVENVADAIVHHHPEVVDSEARAREMLDRLHVQEHVVDRLPWTFSGAEAQRVALAKTLAPRPAVVLLDEPLGALDKRTGAAVRTFLDDWFTGFDGIVLYATTRADDLERFADELVMLDR